MRPSSCQVVAGLQRNAWPTCPDGKLSDSDVEIGTASGSGCAVQTGSVDMLTYYDSEPVRKRPRQPRSATLSDEDASMTFRQSMTVVQQLPSQLSEKMSKQVEIR